METVKEPQMNFLTGAWRFIYSKTTRTHFIFAAAVAAVPGCFGLLDFREKCCQYRQFVSDSQFSVGIFGVLRRQSVAAVFYFFRRRNGTGVAELHHLFRIADNVRRYDEHLSRKRGCV